MTSSNDVINFSISAYHLWRHRWRHRGQSTKNKYDLESSYKDANLGIFIEGIGSQTKKLWPRVLYMTSSLFPSITHISKIAVNHNFWPIFIILDENESWWPKFHEKYFCILMGGLWRHKTTSLFYENSVIAYDAYDVIKGVHMVVAYFFFIFFGKFIAIPWFWCIDCPNRLKNNKVMAFSSFEADMTS